jgi:hypothetical protein
MNENDIVVEARRNARSSRGRSAVAVSADYG